MDDRRALIENGVVVNVVKAGNEWTPPDGLLLGPPGGEIGDAWDGKSYIKSTPVVPPPTSDDINEHREQRISSGFAVNFGDPIGTKRFQSDAKSQAFIADLNRSAFAASLDPQNQKGDLRWFDPERDFKFIAEDNSEIPMDADTAYAFTEAFTVYKSAVQSAARSLKNGATQEDYANDRHWPSSTLSLI